MNRHRVPIRVVRPGTDQNDENGVQPAPPVADAVPPVVEARASPPAPPPNDTSEGDVQPETNETTLEELEKWRDRALRLEAEIDNFRKRQRRLAEERIVDEKERLLRAFLAVTDDLLRALGTDQADVESLRAGVELTHQSMLQTLRQEGAEPIDAAGAPFDPAWHEAVGTVPHQQAGLESHTVAQVVQQGYRIDGRLLRPARVIVAV